MTIKKILFYQIGTNLKFYCIAVGNPQVFVILMFIRQLIDDHPLCSCSEEISLLKRDIITKTDDLKLKQKLSSISLTMNEGLYIHKVDIQIPENYPDSAVRFEEHLDLNGKIMPY